MIIHAVHDHESASQIHRASTIGLAKLGNKVGFNQGSRRIEMLENHQRGGERIRNCFGEWDKDFFGHRVFAFRAWALNHAEMHLSSGNFWT
jgi:hypothetical protein